MKQKKKRDSKRLNKRRLQKIEQWYRDSIKSMQDKSKWFAIFVIAFISLLWIVWLISLSL